jgi:hypothetical protein
LNSSDSGRGQATSSCEHGKEPSDSIKAEEFLHQLNDSKLLKKESAPLSSLLYLNSILTDTEKRFSCLSRQNIRQYSVFHFEKHLADFYRTSYCWSLLPRCYRANLIWVILVHCSLQFLGRRPQGRPRRRWEDNIKMDLRDIGFGDVDWIHCAQDRDRWRALVNTVMNLRVP